jgi:hypothetical protein
LSHSETEKIEPNPEDGGQEDVSEAGIETEGTIEAEPDLGEGGGTTPEMEPDPAPPVSGMASDPRFSRLMKMQSQYVTEEAIRSTEEKARPKKPEPVEEDESYEDDDEFYDEDYDDFEDDEYDDEDIAPQPAEAVPVATVEVTQEPEPEDEPEDDTDHRVAQLRKLNKEFVTEKDLKELPRKSAEFFQEAKIARVVCPHCQSEEIRTEKICTQCGARLPNITAVEEETYNPGTLNSAVLKYFDAVKKLKNETWSVDEFEDFLHERMELSRNHIDGLLELVEECGSSEWLPDGTKLIMESTMLLEESIENMLIKVEEARGEQHQLEAEFDALLLAWDEDSDADPPEDPAPLEVRIRMIDYQSDLDNIKKANGLLLNTLKIIDQFQKKAHEDLEVSM